jgi:hypothetical protein
MWNAECFRVSIPYSTFFIPYCDKALLITTK